MSKISSSYGTSPNDIILKCLGELKKIITGYSLIKTNYDDLEKDILLIIDIPPKKVIRYPKRPTSQKFSSREYDLQIIKFRVDFKNLMNNFRADLNKLKIKYHINHSNHAFV